MTTRTRNTIRGSAAVALAVVLWAAPAPGQVYVFKDADGITHFTDTPPHTGFELHPSSLRVRPRLRSQAWDGVIARTSRMYAVPPALVKAVIHTESAFDPLAISRRGARGLMQLMPTTARALGVDDPHDPWQNIDGGTRYLRYLIERYKGDTTLALAAYNAGESAVRRFGGIPPYGETERYVRKVLVWAARYDADFR
jgi:soluble lytic murein transglycosylase